MTRRYAVLPGDGIGIDVTREAVKALEAASEVCGFGLELRSFDYGAERYLRDGTTLPAGEVERLRRDVDAIFLGALGDPRIPDMRHGREIPIVQSFDMAAEEARVRAVFAKLGDRYGTRAQTAIRFALANPDLSCVVVGFAEIAHIEEALAGAEMGPLPGEALAALREVYAAPLP